MTQKASIAVFIAVAILLIAGIALFAGSSLENSNVDDTTTTPEVSPAVSVLPSPNNSQVPTNTTTPTISPKNSNAPAVSIYTSAQVALHANAQSCWTIIRGGVYDLTTWIKKHPGGAQAILQLCGTDGTEEFDEQHKGQGRPEAALASFKIGVLGQ